MKKPQFIYDFIKSKNTKAKATILLLPGFAANFGPYHKVLNKFNDYDIYMLFVPGGLEINCKAVYKEMNEMLRFKYIADYVADFIKFKKLKNIILMGQCIATAMMGLVENKVSNLILKVIFIAPYCKTYGLSKKLIRKYLPVNNVNQLIESGKIIFKKPKAFKSSAYLARCQEMVKKSLKLQKQLVFFMDQEIYNNKTFAQITKAYHQFKTPTLICMSKQDPVLIFNKGYKELKTLMPKAKIVVFNNSKHMLFEEEPTKFVKVVKQFLK